MGEEGGGRSYRAHPPTLSPDLANGNHHITSPVNSVQSPCSTSPLYSQVFECSSNSGHKEPWRLPSPAFRSKLSQNLADGRNRSAYVDFHNGAIS